MAKSIRKSKKDLVSQGKPSYLRLIKTNKQCYTMKLNHALSAAILYRGNILACGLFNLVAANAISHSANQ